MHRRGDGVYRAYITVLLLLCPARHTPAALTTLSYLRIRFYQREFNGRTETDGDNVIAEVLKRKNHTQPHILFHTVTHKRNYNPL